MPLDESIRFVADKDDKAILKQISQENGNASMSATIRLLIRNEAKRRGIEVTVSQEQTPEPSR